MLVGNTVKETVKSPALAAGMLLPSSSQVAIALKV